jgi:hypothetical protein
MIRSVYVESHTEAAEQPTLFDTESPPIHDFFSYTINFEFRENDTIVFCRPVYITTKPRDWHFKARLREAIKKEIKDDNAFKLTKWNVRDKFTYDFTLKDNAGILNWMGKKELMALFQIV